jgi:N4-gp56 family major capsid protein
MVAASVTNSSVTRDQEKFLASKLIARATLKMVAASLCDKVKMKEGAGLTAYFVRYSRMNVALTSLTEGTTPSAGQSISLEEFTTTMDQWGDFIVLSDVSELTAKHPLAQECLNLLADSAQRVIDREIQKVWLAGTNVQYGDGSVTSRSAITTSLIMNNATIERALVTMQNNGAPERGGPADMDFTTNNTSNARIGKGYYVAVSGPEVIQDLQASSTSFGTFASVATYANAQALYAGEVGIWKGVRWVGTNFIPRFRLLGNTTTAVVSGNAFGTGTTPVVTAVDGGGSLTSATTYFFKVSRKDKTRGFEEFISIEHTMDSAATANNESFTFNFSSLTAGYVYNLYFGSSTGDANLKLHTENIEVGTTVTVTTVPSSTTTAPANVGNDAGTGRTVHPVYILGAEACKWTSLQELKVLRGGGVATEADPLAQRKTIGYKFMAKALICDQTRLLRVEVYSAKS